MLSIQEIEHMYLTSLHLHLQAPRYSLAAPSREPSKEPPIPERDARRTVTEMAGLRWTWRKTNPGDVMWPSCWCEEVVLSDVPLRFGMIRNWWILGVETRERTRPDPAPLYPLLEGQVVAQVPFAKTAFVHWAKSCEKNGMLPRAKTGCSMIGWCMVWSAILNHADQGLHPILQHLYKLI